MTHTKHIKLMRMGREQAAFSVLSLAFKRCHRQNGRHMQDTHHTRMCDVDLKRLLYVHMCVLVM